MLIEPFPLILAFLPLSAYLLLIGMIRLVAAPVVTTGGRDLGALAVGISGLVAIGPAELFFPGPAAASMGAYVWLVLLLFYILAVSLVILSLPTRLVVYGMAPQSLLEPLREAAAVLDPAATSDPRRPQVFLPTLGVRLRIDGNPLVETSQIAAFEPNLPAVFWGQLLAALRKQTQGKGPRFRTAGWGMIALGLVLAIPPLLAAVSQPEAVVAGLQQWLWR